MRPLILPIFLIGFWLLIVRPQQQRLRAQRQVIAALSVGDKIVTAGGIVGRIVGLDDEHAQVEVSPGVRLTFLRAAVNRRIAQAEDEDAAIAAGTDDWLASGDGALAAGLDMRDGESAESALPA
jgi:preprotein translocase subunit YajC